METRLKALARAPIMAIKKVLKFYVCLFFSPSCSPTSLPASLYTVLKADFFFNTTLEFRFFDNIDKNSPCTPNHTSKHIADLSNCGFL